MKQTIEKNLTDAIEKMIPEDMYDRIEKNLEVHDCVKKVEKINNSKKMRYLKYTKYLAAAACLLFVIGLGGNTYYTQNLVVDSVIDIDVNPSIELTTNKKDVVMEANAINSEGSEVLNNMDLEGVDLDVAVNAIIGAMLQNGYFDRVENYILVSVQNDDNKKAEDIKQSIVTNINTTLDSGDFTASLIDQTIEIDEAIEAFAKAYGISVGKSTFIWNLAKEDPTLDVEELAKYSISEIMEIINSKVDSTIISDETVKDDDAMNEDNSNNHSLVTSNVKKDTSDKKDSVSENDECDDNHESEDGDDDDRSRDGDDDDRSGDKDGDDDDRSGDEDGEDDDESGDEDWDDDDESGDDDTDDD